jgi:2-polyprenyl-6-methoxyphenol hydroxylase-like FAD-dependent oxidoreductase
MSDQKPVLIVGAGPTGLVAAHELARVGIRCRLVDKNPPRARESRAIAIRPRTVESFELMGLVSGAARRALAGGPHLADPRWIALFSIHRRIAGHFRRRRAFLPGDAGHIHSPVGGHGMNMGVQDAFNLAWKLALGARQRRAPSPARQL